MEKVNEIFQNKKFISYAQEIKKIEQDRIFCKHGIEHSLDVARIAYIKVLENNLDFSKEVIYSIALLHDLGRVVEYKENIPHNKAGFKIAQEILSETNFSNKEKAQIINAILKHRGSLKYDDIYYKDNLDKDEIENILKLSEIILLSDKESRMCFNCKAEDKCYWDKEKKNFNIKI